MPPKPYNPQRNLTGAQSPGSALECLLEQPSSEYGGLANPDALVRILWCIAFTLEHYIRPPPWLQACCSRKQALPAQGFRKTWRLSCMMDSSPNVSIMSAGPKWDLSGVETRNPETVAMMSGV